MTPASSCGPAQSIRATPRERVAPIAAAADALLRRHSFVVSPRPAAALHHECRARGGVPVAPRSAKRHVLGGSSQPRRSSRRRPCWGWPGSSATTPQVSSSRARSRPGSTTRRAAGRRPARSERRSRERTSRAGGDHRIDGGGGSPGRGLGGEREVARVGGIDAPSAARIFGHVRAHREEAQGDLPVLA